MVPAEEAVEKPLASHKEIEVDALINECSKELGRSRPQLATGLRPKTKPDMLHKQQRTESVIDESD